MTGGADLYDLIRQLKTELAWAVRTGIIIEERPAPPPMEEVRVAAPPPRDPQRDSQRPQQNPPRDMREPSRDMREPPRDMREPSRDFRDAPPREMQDPRDMREPPRNFRDEERDAQRPSQRPQQNPPRDFRDEPPRDMREPPRDMREPPRNFRDEQRESPRPQPNPPPRTGGGIDKEGRARTEEQLVQIGARPSLAAIREVLGECTRCKLHRQGRSKIVYGVGSATAELMFVGEGPGADEDRLGEPFVGKAGQLLTTIIERGMGLRRSDVYIANVVKCRPPQNRDPEPDEVDACEPFLRAQIRSINPKVIITLGKHASHALLKIQTPITRLRGRWSEYDGIPVMPTYHPAYLLRNPAEKRAVWEDIQEVLRRIGRPIPERPARE